MSSHKILVIEDDKVIAFDLKFNLEKLGYTVCGIASTYEDAVRQALSTEPDLALMDIQIKGARSGIDTSLTFRENFDIPVIFLTSSIESGTVARAIETEPLAYLVKPVRTEELKTNIELAMANHLRNKRLKSELENISSAMRSVGTPMIVTGMDRNISYMNLTSENLSGWLLQEVKSKNIDELLSSDSIDITPLFKDAEESQSSVNLPDGASLTTKKNGKIEISGAVSSFADQEGKTAGYLVVFDDKSAAKKEILKQSIISDVPSKEATYLTDEYFFIKDKGQMFRVNLNEINFIEALGDYVMVNCDKKRYTTLMTMKKLEQMLPSDKFARVHRSFIVSVEKITSINSNDFDLFIGDKRIPIGETYKQDLLKKIKVL